MTAIFLYDDARARQFEPFALTRPCGEMRAGALLIRERWERVLGAPSAGHITSPHLAGFEEPGAAPVYEGAIIPAGSWIVNSRFAPALNAVGEADVLTSRGVVAAVRTLHDIPASQTDGTRTLDTITRSNSPRELEGHWLGDVWDFIGMLMPMLSADIPALGASLGDSTPSGSIRLGDHPVFVEPAAVVEEGVCFDVTGGPVFVGAGSHVLAFTRLVGPLYVGRDCTVMCDRIAASSIGDVCKVHGELSNSIFIGHSNKGHDGFVGHSILGRWVNLGAGTITSNLKNTYGTVSLWTPDGVRDSGLQFLGTLFGDHAKTGIGLRLTTGSVLGAGSNVYGVGMPPKAVAPFSWGEAGRFVEFRFDKFLEIAARMMSRRHVELTEGGRAQLQKSFDARWTLSA